MPVKMPPGLDAEFPSHLPAVPEPGAVRVKFCRQKRENCMMEAGVGMVTPVMGRLSRVSSNTYIGKGCIPFFPSQECPTARVDSPAELSRRFLQHIAKPKIISSPLTLHKYVTPTKPCMFRQVRVVGPCAATLWKAVYTPSQHCPLCSDRHPFMLPAARQTCRISNSPNHPLLQRNADPTCNIYFY